MPLREVCQSCVMGVLQRILGKGEDQQLGQIQLVVDETMLHVIGSLCKMSDLYDHGITSVEPLEKARQPLPELDALYFLWPSVASVQRVLTDFKDKGKPQHQKVHLAFASRVADSVFSMIVESENLAKRIASFVEVPTSFSVFQERGFHFNMPDALPKLFPRPSFELLAEIKSKLACLCRCLNVTPTIRHAQTEVCQNLAKGLQTALSSVQMGSGNDEVASTLLIVDRSVDLAAVLVHEYTYEAFMYDVLDGDKLDIDTNVVNLSGKASDVWQSDKSRSGRGPDSGRPTLISDDDGLWAKLKHRPLFEIPEFIQHEVKMLNVKYAHLGAMEGDDQHNLDSGRMLDLGREMPEYLQLKAKYSFHMDLHVALNEKFSELKLSLPEPQIGVGLLEQDIACGVDAVGKDVQTTSLVSRLNKVISDSHMNLSSEMKLRLLLLYFSCMGNVQEKARRSMIEQAKISPEEQQVLLRVLDSGLIPVSGSDKKGDGHAHRGTKERKQKFKKITKLPGALDLFRFQPYLRDLFEALAQGTLSTQEFPELGSDQPCAGLRAAAKQPRRAPRGPSTVQTKADGWSFSDGPVAAVEDVKFVQDRRQLIIFVVGGYTYSEMRAAAEVARTLPAGVELLLGGTSVLTPRRLLRVLEESAGGAKGSSNGASVDLT